jgi:hypothetical protein
MSKRKIINVIPKPNYIGRFRHVHGVLRNKYGFMVFSVVENGKVTYKLTDVLDLPIQPNSIGRREFNKRWLNHLSSRVVSDNYEGDLYMYCTHQHTQKLLPISEFTINRGNTQFYRADKNGVPYQPYCKESKRQYQNQPGNKLRTQTQLLEGVQGSRTRGLLTSMCVDNKPPTLEELFETFGSRCFHTGKLLDINDRDSYEIDHLMPASGYHPLNKFTSVLLSKESNQKKKDNHPLAFYGEPKFRELCGILKKPITEEMMNKDYILNDEVLYYFNNNFEVVIYKWHFEVNRNKDSFKKYLSKEISRISKKDIYGRHTNLLNKMKEYEKKI